MAEQQLDLNAAAEALSEAVVGAVAAVDAQAPAEPPAVPAPGVQEVVPQGSAEMRRDCQSSAPTRHPNLACCHWL